MFFELFNNALMDSSFFYLYFGLALVSLGMMYLINLQHHAFISDYFLVDNHQYMKINLTHLEKPFIINESFVVWLVTTYKRIAEKDDKEDNPSSYFKHVCKIRGGQLWKETAYSLPLKNTVF